MQQKDRQSVMEPHSGHPSYLTLTHSLTHLLTHSPTHSLTYLTYDYPYHTIYHTLPYLTLHARFCLLLSVRISTTNLAPTYSTEAVVPLPPPSTLENY